MKSRKMSSEQTKYLNTMRETGCDICFKIDIPVKQLGLGDTACHPCYEKNKDRYKNIQNKKGSK